MPLAKCVRCQKMFNKTNVAVCPRCKPKEDEDQEKVRGIVSEHPNLNAEAIADMADVEVNVVTRMIDCGHIATFLDTNDAKCGRCGAPAISASKKLCQACLDKLEAEVVKAQHNIRLDGKKRVELGKYNEQMGVREILDDKRKK